MCPDVKDAALVQKLLGNDTHPAWGMHQLLTDFPVDYVEKIIVGFNSDGLRGLMRACLDGLGDVPSGRDYRAGRR